MVPFVCWVGEVSQRHSQGKKGTLTSPLCAALILLGPSSYSLTNLTYSGSSIMPLEYV